MRVLNAKAQRSKDTEKIRRIVIRVGLTGVLLIIALVIVPRVRGYTLGDAEAFIGAPLPANAQNVQFATRDQFTRLVWIRFTLPSDADVTPFVQAMGLPTDIRETFTPFPAQNYTEADMTWWTPYAAQVFSGLYAIHNGKVYELLLDHTDSAALTVYLRVYGL
jgi:hypothetical protein